MKKIFIVLLTILLLTGCKENKTVDETLMKSNDLNDIVIEDVTSLDITKYTEAGIEELTINEYDEILKKYNYLNNFKIGKETNKTCEDNTVIYKFKQSDKIISIEIECEDVLITNNKRYELIK